MDSVAHILERLYQCYDLGRSPSAYFSYAQICNLINSASDEVRASLAKALVNHDCQEDAVMWLSQLAKDQDPLVRAEAVDSMRAFVCRQGFDALCQATKDSDSLVRGYAAYGVAVVGKEFSFAESAIVLQNMASIENAPRVLVDVYEGLYILGQVDALKKLFALINTDDYHVQCAIIHACEEIANDCNRNDILSFLSEGVPINNVAVERACRTALKNIAGQRK